MTNPYNRFNIIFIYQYIVSFCCICEIIEKKLFFTIFGVDK
jgi:hypothetical protein